MEKGTCGITGNIKKIDRICDFWKSSDYYILLCEERCCRTCKYFLLLTAKNKTKLI